MYPSPEGTTGKDKLCLIFWNNASPTPAHIIQMIVFSLWENSSDLYLFPEDRHDIAGTCSDRVEKAFRTFK